MRIDEYTHREVPQSSGLGSVDIRLPDQLRKRDFSGVEKALEGLSRVGGMYADTLDKKPYKEDSAVKKAKNDRDKAVSGRISLDFEREFVNQERIQKFSNKREKAETAVINLDKWYGETLGGILSATKENPYDLNGTPVYLENEEQKAILTEKAYNWYQNRQIQNTEWWGSENAKFNTETINAQIEDGVKYAENSQSTQEFENNMLSIRQAIIDKNNGNMVAAKAEFVEIGEKAALGNISMNMNTEPYAATVKLKELGKYISKEKMSETQEAVRKAVRSDQIRKIAEGTQDRAFNEKFYKEYSKTLGIDDIDGFVNEIQVEGQKQRDIKEAHKNEIETKISYELAVDLIDAEDDQQKASSIMGLKNSYSGRKFLEYYDVYNNEMQELAKATIMSTGKDTEIASILKTTDLNEINRARMEARNTLYGYTDKYEKGVDITNQAIRDINSGSVKFIKDIDAYSNLHPNHKKQILVAMANKRRIDNFITTAKTETGMSFDNKLNSLFKAVWNKNGYNPGAENIFRTEMSERLSSYMSKKGWTVPTDKELETMALDVMGETVNGSLKGQLWNAVRETTFKKDMYTRTAYIDKLTSEILDEIDGSFLGIFTSKSKKDLAKRAATYMADGDIDSAVFLLQDLDK